MEDKGGFYILSDISEHLTLVQLMDTVGNINHASSITENWLFGSN